MYDFEEICRALLTRKNMRSTCRRHLKHEIHDRMRELRHSTREMCEHWLKTSKLKVCRQPNGGKSCRRCYANGELFFFSLT